MKTSDEHYTTASLEKLRGSRKGQKRGLGGLLHSVTLCCSVCAAQTLSVAPKSFLFKTIFMIYTLQSRRAVRTTAVSL